MLKMSKEQIAKILEDMAAILEFQGENPFKVRAYLNGAHTLLNIQEDFEKVIRENRLRDYEGIGDHLNEKIKILATTGTHPAYEELIKTTPPGLFDLLRVHGMGSKKIKTLYDELHITSIPELKEACISGKVAKIRGFGQKSVDKILQNIDRYAIYSKRMLWWHAHEIAEPILKGLQALKGVKKADVAGSLRRGLETVGDLDLVVAASNPDPIMDWFISYPGVESVITHGSTKSSIRLQKGTQVELRIVPEKQYAFTLLYSTGSKGHNIKLRQLALKKGLSLSEWGLAPDRPKVKDPFANSKKIITETDIYRVLGMEYIPPELREDTGEIEAAQKGKLPHLVELKDIKGTFHVHTSASAGRLPLEAMIKECEKMKWEYVGITDHSKSSFQANGLSEERLLEQISQIQKINRSRKYKIYVFAGTECDILPTGKLDFSNNVLKELDFVIASVHSSMQQDAATMTKRLIQAIENPYTTMLGHVTGRLLLQREPYALDLQKVIDACIANNVIMELNAHPSRLDMDWRHWHKAAEKGLICSINPDAHTKECLQYIPIGINIARKGWLQKDQIFNTLPLAEVKKFLK